MMLHRHFEDENARERMTTSSGLTGEEREEYISEIFPPEEKKESDKPKRGRRKAADE